MPLARGLDLHPITLISHNIRTPKNDVYTQSTCHVACVRGLTAKVGIRGRGVPARPQFSEHRSRESQRLASQAASHVRVSTSNPSTSNARMVDNVDEAVEAEEEEVPKQ